MQCCVRYHTIRCLHACRMDEWSFLPTKTPPKTYTLPLAYHRSSLDIPDKFRHRHPNSPASLLPPDAPWFGNPLAPVPHRFDTPPHTAVPAVCGTGLRRSPSQFLALRARYFPLQWTDMRLQSNSHLHANKMQPMFSCVTHSFCYSSAISRYRNVTICPRVHVIFGENAVLLVPAVMPCSCAQRLAL